MMRRHHQMIQRALRNGGGLGDGAGGAPSSAELRAHRLEVGVAHSEMREQIEALRSAHAELADRHAMASTAALQQKVNALQDALGSTSEAHRAMVEARCGCFANHADGSAARSVVRANPMLSHDPGRACAGILPKSQGNGACFGCAVSPPRAPSIIAGHREREQAGHARGQGRHVARDADERAPGG